MALFTHNVKRIKGAAHVDGDVDGTCKRDFITIIGFVIDSVFPLLKNTKKIVYRFRPVWMTPEI